ncbi:MAG: HAD family hydrolase [Firmicutes bacterium]|nr:HAD family hydrolase [Bacillota bacterium]
MKLIVWDFDGTLADSRALIVAGMEHALGTLGLSNLPGIREEWLKYVGLPVEEGLKRTFEPLNLDPDQVLKAYRSFDWPGHEHLLVPFPGMDALVKELHGLGMPMAIASSKRGLPLKRQVEAFGWTACFDPFVTPDEVTHGKPHPESLRLCLKAHGLEPSQAVMVGDTPFDLEMANRAGVPGIAVGHGFYDREALEVFRPVAYAPDVPALREILLALMEVK